MEITLKNRTMYSDRSFRFYCEGSIPLLEKVLKDKKEKIKFISRKAETACSIVGIQNEIELKKHKDYKIFHSLWLITHKKRIEKFNQQIERKNFWIDKEIKELKNKKQKLIKL
jgi:hypothetical protein